MAYFQQQQQTAVIERETIITSPIDLSGSAVTLNLFTAIGQRVAIKAINAIYDEASSADAGVRITAGKSDHPAYFAIHTSEVSQSAGTVRPIAMFTHRIFIEDEETLIVSCDGGKAGAGEVRIQIELEIYRETEASLTFTEIVKCFPIILAGFNTQESIFTAIRGPATINSIDAIYIEASSSNAGIDIDIGKIGDADFFATYISEVSQSLGTVKSITPSSVTLALGETLTVSCDGGKVGSGAVYIQIEIEVTK